MSEPKKMQPREEQSPRRRKDARTVLRPAVDIFEDAKGITLYADLPGVPNSHLNVRLDKDTLLIEGEAQLDTPDNMEPLYVDLQSNLYRRSFSLSSELTTEKVEARLKDGVLTLRIPKAEASKPRKIEVQTD
jgi:HSP20 family molecular chaperone IbpA